MATLGGLLFEEGQAAIVAKCGFDSLSFFRSDREAYRIQVPMLTYREVRFLDANLPIAGSEQIAESGIPSRDIDKYKAIYRYFPTFAEMEF